MNEQVIHKEAEAAITRLQEKHSDLKDSLENSYGYAVFPSVGRASLVLGGAYGHGEVYERGKPIGFATMSQITIGVQVGGQSFSEILLFPKKENLDEFKTGKVAFNANASAAIVKAAASGTGNFGGVTAHAYSRGGMLLELSLGGQKFTFIPPRHPEEERAAAGEEEEQETPDMQQARGDGEERAAAEGEGEEPSEEAEEPAGAEMEQEEGRPQHV